MASKVPNQSPSVPVWCNEQVVELNRLPPRSYFIPETCLSLNGDWDFNYAPSPLHAPDPSSLSKNSGSSIFTPSEDSSQDDNEAVGSVQTTTEWSKLVVPGHWQLQGYGKPHYTNVIYPFPVCPPYVPSNNPTGTYRRTFQVPTNWKDTDQLRLRFDGVDSAYHIWLNGEEIGYSQGSRNAAEFDVSTFVKRNETNTLVVRVYQWCDGSYIEDQDQWWLSGIFRDVFLLAFPSAARIEDVFITTDLDATYRDAKLQIRVDMRLENECELTAVLRKHDGNQNIIADQHVTLDADSTREDLELSIQEPLKWTAETPYLYDLQISLAHSNGTIHQTIQQRVGFRKVELKDGLMTVNGTPIFLRGTNRHEHHPLHGRAVPLDFIRRDLLLMKQHNINAVRTSHYPSHPKLYDMCDELGLWIMDEADLECHGFYDAVSRPLDIPEDMDYDERKRLTFPEAAKFTSDNESWRHAYLDRMKQLVQRDKNHPSVIMWSLGNESFYGSNHKAMYAYAKATDPTRLVHYEGDAQAVSADMFSYMYPSVDLLVKRAKTEGVREDGSFDKPMILCEYAHAMGNSPGWLEEYQAAFRDVPRLQGGFIWEWANHGLLKQDEGKTYYAYGGDFGDIPNDGTFVMDGLCFSDHTPTPGLHALKKTIAPVRLWVEDDEVVLENGYDFIGLEHLSADYKTEVLGFNGAKIVDSGHLHIPNTLPGRRSRMHLPKSAITLPNVEVSYITISLRLKKSTSWAEAGHEIAWCQSKLDNGSGQTRKVIPESIHAHSQLSFRSSKSTFIVNGANFSISFDHSSGHLTSWIFNNCSILEQDPLTLSAISPGFWRAPTDNDLPTATIRWKHYGLHALTSQLRNLTIDHANDDEIRLTAHTYVAPPILAWGFDVTTTYHVSSNGALSIRYNIQPRGPKPKTLPRVGLDLRLASRLSNASWFGLGPGESYPDKKTSQRTGIWSATTKQLHTPYEVPQENGNRMETGWVRLADERGFGFRAHRVVHEDGDGLFQWAAGRYSAAALEAAKHPCDLVEEDAVLLRLDVAQAGVGTGACGPEVKEDCLVKCEQREFEFVLEPLLG